MIKVSLLAYTPDPQRVIAAAAKLCYSPSSADELLDGLTPEKTERFLDMLSEIGHESPIEHASFTFAIEGVSRTFLAQITRHRIASFSVQSQRYVDKGDFEYVLPPAIAADPQALAVYEDAMRKAREAYDTLAQLLTEQHTAELARQGKPADAAAKAAHKMAIEDARFVLPGACDTKMVVTMNARSLHNFFRLRCCARAQWEIHAVADQMLQLVSGVAPALFRSAGPACLAGPCPEGKMSCGRQAEVRARYQALKKG